MVTITPLLGVPAAGTQLFVQPGGLNVHVVPHSTVLFDEQSKENVQPPGGAITVKFTVQLAGLEAQS
jgi:hypothetical protein